MALYGGIEAGGTKFACVIGTGPEGILAETRIATTTPEETIGRAIAFFRLHTKDVPISALGVASFGPVDLDPWSPKYGFITTTPKSGWSQVDLLGPIEEALQLPVVFDTDVNAAAFGEHHWVTENRGLDPLLYVTVGTGIGVGAIVQGRPLHGLAHPEAGHMRLPHDSTADPFDGACSFHGDCWEGLASGPALERRWGAPGETLPARHPAWELEAHYLGLGLGNLICCFSPQKVMLGGGVMQVPGLIDRVRTETWRTLQAYPPSARLAGDVDRLLVRPRLGERSGVLGALALASTRIL